MRTRGRSTKFPDSYNAYLDVIRMLRNAYLKRIYYLITFTSFVLGLVLLSLSTNISPTRQILTTVRATVTSNLTSRILTTKTPKRFLYLTQTPSCLPEHLKGEKQIGNGSTCDCDVLVLGYKGKCQQKPSDHIEYLYLKGTTWTTGRNYLYEQAMERSTKYHYYIFMDDDIKLRLNANSKNMTRTVGPWRSFEKFLIAYRPPIASTPYCSGASTKCVTTNVPSVYVVKRLIIFDAAFNAIHYEALPYLLPYNTKGDARSWWFSQAYLQMLATYYFKDFVLIYSEVTTVNVLHRKYPRSGIATEMYCNFEAFVDILRKRNKLPPKWNGVKVSDVAMQICKC